MVAKAIDGGGLSCQSDIVLSLEDINDNGPVFSMNHYSVTVYDNTTLKTPVAVVIARDPDEGKDKKSFLFNIFINFYTSEYNSRIAHAWGCMIAQDY